MHQRQWMPVDQGSQSEHTSRMVSDIRPPLRDLLTGTVASITAPVRRRLAPSVAPLDGRAVRDAGYFSQYGQDVLLDRLLTPATCPEPTFVDVGAHDGVTFSNTCFLERRRGWSGICIEPNPDVFGDLSANRTCDCHQVAIGSQSGRAEFRRVDGYGQMLSGLEATHDRRHRRRIEAAVRQHGGGFRTDWVDVSRLDDLLSAHGVERFELLCIDVEGGELEVIASIDLDAFGVEMVVVENNYGSSSIMRALEDQGFRLLLHVAQDEIYVRSPSKALVSLPAGTS